MRKFTQKDFDNFEIDEDGRRICPTGDYTAIKEFGDYCKFGVGSKFDEYCKFGKYCIFDEQCRFGWFCWFGEHCKFGKWCIFSEHCIFGEYCKFYISCNFGNGCNFSNGCRFSCNCGFDECCRFGENCSFGEWCTFGEWCNFGKRCHFENDAVKNGKYIAIDRIGREERKAYFFIDENGKMYVRAGCWFSDLDSFKERVKEVYDGGIHEKTYLAACDLAELMLKEYE